MMNKAVLFTIFIFTASIFPVFASGQAEAATTETGTGLFSTGIQQYSEGNLTEAASSFRQAAASNNPETAAAAYYNQGRVQAELAEQTQDPAEKRNLLEESYQSLKRATELGSLPPAQQKGARQNMQIVRERLSELPDESPEEQEGQDGQDEQQQEGQDGQQQDGQDGQAQEGQDGESGQSGQSGQSPEEMLQRQRDLSSRTDGGEGSSQELADEQKQLQKDSEAADMNEAAVNQAKAAQALKQGDREKASDYQKAAEQALASEVEDENVGSEAEDIMNQEAENDAQRNRLDKMGGITDAERNW